MNKIWMLTAASLRKSKSQTMSMLLFMMIAALFLNVGLVIFFGMGSFFDTRAEKAHMAHFTAIYEKDSETIDKLLAFIKNDKRVVETEILQAVGETGSYFSGDLENSTTIYFSPAISGQKMDAPSMVGASRPLIGDAIYIPYFIMVNGDYRVGDPFKVKLLEQELEFTIAGGTEEIMFGAQMNTINRFYISDEKWNEMKEQFSQNNVTFVSARLEDREDTSLFQVDFDDADFTDGLLNDFIYDNAKQARTMIPMIAATLVTAFAIILLCVSLIVIRFRIANSIEDGMVNLGVQKAMGYRSRQIVASVVLQFGCIAAAGGVMGVILSQAVIPAIIGMLEPMLGMRWQPGWNEFTISVTMFSVIITSACIAFLSANRIKRLQPLTALRGGITTHSFRRNAISLDKVSGPLPLLLAMKQLLRNKKQVLTVSLIVSAVTMAAVSCMGMKYSFIDGAGALLGEISDAVCVLEDSDGNEAFQKRMLEYPEVRKVFGYEDAAIMAGEASITTTVVEDCSLLEGQMLIDGRYPKYDNEIAIGTTCAKVTGKKTGDTIIVSAGAEQEEYIVSGIVQIMNNNGLNGIISGEGYKRIQPDFRFKGYSVYLKEDTDVKAFIDRAERDENDRAGDGSAFENVVDIEEQFSVVMGTIADIFAAVAIGILIFTGLVVILVLYMVIKTNILRRRREFGIQKAVGYTTMQLMNQVALGMTPIILIGVIVGAVAGHMALNPLVVMLTKSMGVVKVEFPLPVMPTLILCLCVIALAYGVSLLVSWQIRRISAYVMISE